MQPLAEIAYGEIPGIGSSTVAGHAGRLIHARIGATGIPVLVMAGRRHIYEGLTAAQATALPRLVIETFPRLQNIIISNAAGGLNPAFAVGDLMLISDHINWQFRHPLIGKQNHGAVDSNLDEKHTPVYDPQLRVLARAVGLELQIQLREGIYVAMTGPSYETRAEILMARHLMGGDAIGMSTVPEAIVAAQMRRSILGISFISNMLVDPAPLTHDEVIQNAALVEQNFERLVIGIIQRLAVVSPPTPP